MKKKVIIINIFILLVLTLIIGINSTSKNKLYKNQNNLKENKFIAIYLESEEGKYTKTTVFPSKEDKYILNSNKSICNGNTKLSWNEEVWGLELSSTIGEVTCYLYFDKRRTTEEIISTLNAKTDVPDFSQIATEDEGVYAVSDEMYGGTSYYWRGAVTNNYVKFGGFCWRIVRINGDGSMRLIYDGTTCHANGEVTTDSIAVSNVAYNTMYDKSEYVGWTYVEGKQRPEIRSAIKQSNAKNKIEEWYNTNLASYSSKIADGKFCNARDVGEAPLSWGSGYVTTWSSTGNKFAYIGIQKRTDSSPSLSCNKDDIYTLKIGLLTVDDVIYAGGIKSNNLYYLYNGQKYWTISPSQWNGTIARVFSINENGFITNGDDGVTDINVGIRPVINLKSDITVSGGDGTQSNPYVVQ